MKSINATFKNGHFYNLETRKRINFKDGSDLIMLINKSEDLYLVDPNNLPNNPLSSEMKLKKVQSSEYYKSKKILDAGQILYFNISAGFKGAEGNKRVDCCFELILQEDLYVYQKHEDIVKDLLVECDCQVSRLHSGNLDFFEPINAYSLNDAYSKTFVYYFGTFGKGTADIYDKIIKTPHSNDYFLNEERIFK